ncbi:MAG: hypothetical protein ACOYN4_18030, partial [Bacteroidales bacterium]
YQATSMKTIATIITLFSLLSAKAQIEKGTNALGANLGASYNLQLVKESSYQVLSLSVQPVFEHFIAKNLSLGVALNYGIAQSYYNSTSTYNYTVTTNNSENNTQNFGAHIQLKKHWFATNKIAFTLTPLLSTYYNETNATYSFSNGQKGTFNYNNWIHSANCNMGAMYFIKQNLAIEAQSTFFSYSFQPESDDFGNVNAFRLSIIPNNLMIGVKLFFGKENSKIVAN